LACDRSCKRSPEAGLLAHNDRFLATRLRISLGFNDVVNVLNFEIFRHMERGFPAIDF
jgi:hypothetical protein